MSRYPGLSIEIAVAVAKAQAQVDAYARAVRDNERGETDAETREEVWRTAMESILDVGRRAGAYKLVALTPLQEDAIELFFALQDAWPYVHERCTIKGARDRISALLRKHGNFGDTFDHAELDRIIRAQRLIPPTTDEQRENDTWRALCQFLLKDDDAIQFLREWNEGNFEACRRHWPEAPEEVYPPSASVPTKDQP